jgi:sugar O-acyltransferase (sialic acid O-acetyltransferase NeuD family)
MVKAEILVPMLNANEPEARLAGIHVKDGQPVAKGDILFTIETTKAASDVESPESGFIRILAGEGDLLQVGDRLAAITESADDPLPARPEAAPAKAADSTPGLRITRPARTLAESLGLDLATLPTDRLITEEYIRGLGGVAAPALPDDLIIHPETSILVYGAGGHAKAVMEMALATDRFEITGIIDDRVPAGTQVMGIPVLGPRAVLAALAERGLKLAANGVGGIVDIVVRVKLFELLEVHGYDLPVLVHPRATVEPSAQVGAGVQVFANAYVGSEALLHPRCMINTAAVVSHDCTVGAYTHIAPGCMLAGHVHVGERALVGMGVTTAIGITIGDGARIGNGAILLADVPAKAIIQAGKVWNG